MRRHFISRLKNLATSCIRPDRRRSRSSKGNRARSFTTRLGIEPLEDRQLLAIMMETNLSDGTLGQLDGDMQLSLREAIHAINIGAPVDGIAPTSGTFGVDDQIVFAPSLFTSGPQEILLATASQPFGDTAFEILNPMTIVGPGRDVLTFRVVVDGAEGIRIFQVDTDFTISGLTLTGGNPATGSQDGGAISKVGSGSLTVERSRITGNVGGVAGGGINFVGSNGEILSIIDTEISHNFGGGGPHIGGGGVAASLSGDATLRIINSQIEFNETFDRGGGLLISIFSDNNSVVISGSSISHNTGGVTGGVGGILIIDQGVNTEITITDTAIISNHATVLNGNDGAGINASLNEGTVFTMERSLIYDNRTTGQGGGLYFRAEPGSSITIRESRITGNKLQLASEAYPGPGLNPFSGGGIHALLISDGASAARLTISNSTIDNNQTIGDGAGIFVRSANEGPSNEPQFVNELAVVNSTISGNVSSLGTGGGIHLNYDHIQDFSSGIQARFHNVTITENAALNVGGLYSNPVTLYPATVEWDTRLSNTIISGNTNHQADPDNLYGAFNVAESFNNLIGDNVVGADPDGRIFAPDGTDAGWFDSATNGNLYNATNSPLLGPLADNDGRLLPGGFRLQTHLPIYDPGGVGVSPAVDAGRNASAIVPFSDSGGPGTPLALDQRGWGRIIDGDGDTVAQVDIGAVEINPAIDLPGDYNDDGKVDAADYTVWRNNLGLNIVLPNDVTPGVVDASDYQVWKGHYGQMSGGGGAVTTAAVPGDFNGDGVVDLDDLDEWNTNFGSTTNLTADANGNGIVDLADLAMWQEHKGVTTLDQIAGDFNNDGIVDMGDFGLWSNSSEEDAFYANFGMTRGDVFPIIVNGGAGVPLEIAGQAPQVTNVTLGGSNSTHLNYSLAGVVGSGEQLRTVPIGGLDTISITFSEEVLVTLNSLSLTRLQGGSVPTVSQFTYDVATQTATWVYDTPLAIGQYLIQLSDSIHDLDQDVLDGEFNNPWRLVDAAGSSDTFPSGDGAAGGEFRFRFTNLSADFNSDNFVDAADYTVWANNTWRDSGALQTQGDANGDGDVSTADNTIRNQQYGNNFTIWPSIEPGMILVSKATDDNDTNYAFGELSLRNSLAIAAANPGRDTIVFHYSLFGSPIEVTAGQLSISSDVNIVGPGADLLTIDAGGNSRVLNVSSAVDASIYGVTITGGYTEFNGGGIYSEGNLVLERVVVTENRADGNVSPWGGGGGIYQRFGSLAIYESTIEYNTATVVASNDTGGGIYVVETTLVMKNSTVSNNEGRWVGGIYVENANANIINSTISSNSSEGYGGGLGVYDVTGLPSSNVTLTNATVAFNDGGSLLVNYDGGGGIWVQAGGPIVTLVNSIVAGNYNDHGVVDVTGPFSTASKFNLIGAIDGSTGLTDSSNLNGTASSPLDARLAPLGAYGGPTKTHALLSTSPAIDAGSNEKALDAWGSPLAADQRGASRFVDWDLDLDVKVDIGAMELAVEELYS
jgi:hypothetical protein